MKSFDEIVRLENKFKNIIKKHKLSPAEFLTGVHNACCHADAWPTYSFGSDDRHLGGIFDGLAISIKSAKACKFKRKAKSV